MIDSPTTQPPEVVLRNVRRRDGATDDIWIADGVVIATNKAMRIPDDAVVHDLDGWLVLPAMSEPHAHLDKALSADDIENPAGDLDGAIASWTAAGASGLLSHDKMVDRAVRALEKLLVNGVTSVRSHVDIGSSIGSGYVEAVDEARESLGNRMDIQIVGMCRTPIAGADGNHNRDALRTALGLGVDVIGGCSYRESDPEAVLHHLFDIAGNAEKSIDLHVDETLDREVLTLPLIADVVLKTGFGFAVGASHCVSLGMQERPTQHEVAAAVRAAGIGIVTLPQTNLYLQGRGHPAATPRGLTALDALAAEGVLVCAGGDNVQDPFNPVGRSDPLETATFLVLAGHRLAEDAYNMVSDAPRKYMGLPACGVEVGCQADLVAIDTTSVRSGIADAPMARRTFRRGVLVASSDVSQMVTR